MKGGKGRRLGRVLGRVGVGAAIGVALVLGGGVGRAQQAAPTAAGAKAAQAAGGPMSRATQALYDEGLEAAKAEDWARAYEAFGAAWRLRRHPQIGLNLGRAALKVGRHREAAERLSGFLREAGEVSEEDRASVGALLVVARQSVGICCR